MIQVSTKPKQGKIKVRPYGKIICHLCGEVKSQTVQEKDKKPVCQNCLYGK